MLGRTMERASTVISRAAGHCTRSTGFVEQPGRGCGNEAERNPGGVIPATSRAITGERPRRSARSPPLLASAQAGMTARSSVHELPVRFAVAQHLAAIGVERVIDDPFGGVERVVVRKSEMAKAFRDRFETRTFRLPIERVVGIGTVHDLSKQDERRIAGEPVFLQDRLERAFLAVVAEFDPLHVVRNGVEALGFLQNRVGRRKDELAIAVDEIADEPRTGDPVALDVLARDPFHGNLPCRTSMAHRETRPPEAASPGVASLPERLAGLTLGLLARDADIVQQPIIEIQQSLPL